jgi:hypothetical protein
MNAHGALLLTVAFGLYPIAAAANPIVVESSAPVDTGDGHPESLGFLDFGDATDLDPLTRHVFVFLGEKLLSGRREAVYRGGILYLDGEAWLPESAQPRREAHVPAIVRAPADSTMLARVPLVRASVEGGAPLRDAVAAYERRSRANVDTVTAVFRRELARNDYEAAARTAAAHIDTAIAIADRASPMAPRFGPGGGLSVYLIGKGWVYARPASITWAPREPPPVISRYDARYRVEWLRGELSRSDPGVLIYGDVGVFGVSDPAAWREIEAAIKSGEIAEPIGARELERVAMRAKKRPLAGTRDHLPR